MNNQKKSLPLILAMIICIGVYSLCVFLIANNYTASLWTAYCFTVLSIMIEFVVPLLNSGDGDIKTVQVLGLSRIVVTTIYFIVQLIVGIILMAAGAGTIVAIIICAIILAAYLIITLLSVVGGSHIANVEAEIKVSTAPIKSLTDIVELSYNNEKDTAKKEILKELLDAVRYSDPVSSTDEIRMLDNQINAAVHVVKNVVTTGSVDELKQAVNQTLDLVAERNILCRSSK